MVEAVLNSPEFGSLKAHHTLFYDTTRYPFREIVAQGLGISVENLPRLGQDGCYLPPGSLKLEGAMDATLLLKKTYDAFVCEVIGPHLDAILPTGGRLVYQSLACLRIHPGGSASMGHLHCDADYGHQAGQINFWLPLVSVRGANTLHVETEAGSGDYKGLELEYGQVARFYGNSCRHYTVANTTDRTRLSLDFRVVPGPAFDEAHPTINKFFISPNSYYSEATAADSSNPTQFIPRTSFNPERHMRLGLVRTKKPISEPPRPRASNGIPPAEADRN